MESKKYLFIFLFLSLMKYNVLQSTFTRTFSDQNLENQIYEEIAEDIEPNDDKIKILDLLGLEYKPKFKARSRLLVNAGSKFLLHMYQLITSDSLNNIEQKNRKIRNSVNFLSHLYKIERDNCNNIITFSSLKPPTEHATEDTGNSIDLRFNTNSIPANFQLKRSQLRLYQKFTNYNSTEEKFTISIYRRSNTDDLDLMISINSTTSYEGWLEIDVTDVLTEWIKIEEPSKNILHVIASNNELQTNNFGLVGLHDRQHEYHPFIIGYFNGPEIIENLKRTKREINEKRYRNNNKDKMKNKNNKRSQKSDTNKLKLNDLKKITTIQSKVKTCQRMRFTVDFHDLNWSSWIIAPEKFDAYFCGGECNFPLGADMNATNHALVQTLMHLKNPWIPKPCCVPKDLSSISVLYHLNEENVNLRIYRSMIAKSCGCQ